MGILIEELQKLQSEAAQTALTRQQRDDQCVNLAHDICVDVQTIMDSQGSHGIQVSAHGNRVTLEKLSGAKQIIVCKGEGEFEIIVVDRNNCDSVIGALGKTDMARKIRDWIR